MTRILFSMIVAFIGYSTRYISSAGQMIGLNIRKSNRAKGTLIWIVATLFTSASVFIVLFAVAVGNVSTVGAMAGTGLVSLAFFSALVMKETIRKREMVGIFLILVAAALIGLFITESPPKDILLEPLFVIFGILVIFHSLAWFLLRKNKKYLGILIGIFAGTLGGFVPIFQKVATGEVGRAISLARATPATGQGAAPGFLLQIQQVFLNPYALLWIVLSVGSMIVIQFAYKHDKAIRIIPAFSAPYILIPVLLGVICFREILQPLQWTGAALILAGVLVVTMPRVIRHPRSG